MRAERNLYNFQIKRFEIFKAQDPEDDDFDIVFEIDGKKLYAHKFMLCPISTTLNSMLSDRWTKSGEPVKIEGYTFDDFKKFLTFIYSGKCELTDANIFAMVDMAEFYDIPALKEECEIYLSGILNLKNVHQMVELACKYSLKELKIYLDRFIKKKFNTFFTSDKFQNFQKTTVKELVETYHETWHQEELFEAIYKWAENRALGNLNLDPTLNINEAIKDELSEMLRFFKFDRMDSDFFREFVAKKCFLFSDDEWNDILLARKTKLFVKVTDGNGKLLKGEVQCDDVEEIASVVQSVNDRNCDFVSDFYCYWNTEQPKPSKPHKLIKNDKIEWYLLFADDGSLSVVNRNELVETDYLLSEMFAEDGFEISHKCKIDIFC